MKGIAIDDVLQGIAAQEGGRAAKEFAKRLGVKGVNSTFTVSRKGRKRKNRWGYAKGKVICARFTDEEVEVIEHCAKALNLSAGNFMKWAVSCSCKAFLTLGVEGMEEKEADKRGLPLDIYRLTEAYINAPQFVGNAEEVWDRTRKTVSSEIDVKLGDPKLAKSRKR